MIEKEVKDEEGITNSQNPEETRFYQDIEDDRKLKMEMCKRAIKLRDESLREKRGGRND